MRQSTGRDHHDPGIRRIRRNGIPQGLRHFLTSLERREGGRREYVDHQRNYRNIDSVEKVLNRVRLTMIDLQSRRVGKIEPATFDQLVCKVPGELHVDPLRPLGCS